MKKHFPKKSLGQNFLKSKVALKKIISASSISTNDVVLEVGPGRGALTKELLNTGARVFAIEKDSRLIPELSKLFFDEIQKGNLTLIEGDVLDFDIKKSELSKKPFKIIANIPYYITGSFLEKFLSAQTQPIQMVLMLQKEVAQRIVARDGKESILSLSVKVYGLPKIISKVKKEFFSPQPKVDSAILLIESISKKNFRNISEKNFFKLVKTGFLHKRKLLLGNIRSFFPLKNASEALRMCNIAENARAEDLSLENWLCIAQNNKFDVIE